MTTPPKQIRAVYTDRHHHPRLSGIQRRHRRCRAGGGAVRIAAVQNGAHDVD